MNGALSILGIGFFVMVAVLIFLLANSIRILAEYERGVVFRLGRLRPRELGPGLILLIPVADRLVKVPLRTVVHNVPPQDIITKDNVSVKVNAVVYYRVVDARKAVVEVEYYPNATSQLAQTMLRSVLGQHELDELLSQRDRLNATLQQELDRDTEPWGIKVSKVEVKDVDLPENMQRAMAKQAEAEREKRAKVIHAEGEFQASMQLSKAADQISLNPTTLQLRYLQTLTEIAVEKNSTIIFPVPIDMLKQLFDKR
jgi:regulator of protease activity HflC (stomatin/prohibitin superfamily)